MLTDEVFIFTPVLTAWPKCIVAWCMRVGEPKYPSCGGTCNSTILQPGQAADAISTSRAVSTPICSAASFWNAVLGACSALPPNRSLTVRQPDFTVHAGSP